MTASQYLYTSWKNAPNHGFSVYSTSGDIDRADLDVISMITNYRLPADFRRDAGEEEIEKTFPRLFAYFRLPSGKYCMAQAVYIGREYKGFEEAGRTGNYLVHAFIFDENRALRPATFIGSDFFRRDLTLDEWRIKEPPLLPHKEVPDVCGFSDGEITQFINTGDRKRILKEMVQTMLDNMSQSKPVYINDEPANVPLWIKAVSACMPSEYAYKMTMLVNSADDKNASSMIAAVSKPMITSVYHDKFTVMDYRQKMLSSACVFDLRGGNMSSATVGEYADGVVEMLSSNVFGAIEYTDRVSAICRATGLDADRASAVYALTSRRYAGMSLEKLSAVYGDALKYSSFNAAVFADDFCGLVVADNFARNENLKKFLSELYPKMSENGKRALITYYFNNYQGAGSPEAYLSGFESYIPFPLTDFAVLYFNRSGEEYMADAGDDRCKIYLMFAGILKNFGTVARAAGKEPVLAFVAKVCDRFVNLGDDGFVGLLFGCISASNPAATAGYAQRALESLNSRGASAVPPERYFGYLKYMLSQPDVAAVYTEKYIAARADRTETVKFYQKFLTENPRFASVNSIMRAKPANAQFFNELDKYLLVSGPMGRRELVKFYGDYYVRGMDRENIFITQLKNYFNGLTNQARPAEAAMLFSDLRQVAPPDGVTIGELCRAAFSCPAKEAEANLANPVTGKTYNELGEISVNINMYSESYVVATFARMLPTEPYNPKKKDSQNGLSQQAYAYIASQLAYGNLYARIFRPSCMEIFVREYTDRVILLTDGLLRMPNMDEECVINVIVEPLVRVYGFNKYFATALETLGKKQVEPEALLARLLRYSLLSRRAPDGSVRLLVESVFEDMKGGDVKHVFNAAVSSVKAPEQQKIIKQYVDDYNSKHKGGFFGLFKKKK